MLKLKTWKTLSQLTDYAISLWQKQSPNQCVIAASHIFPSSILWLSISCNPVTSSKKQGPSSHCGCLKQVLSFRCPSWTVTTHLFFALLFVSHCHRSCPILCLSLYSSKSQIIVVLSITQSSALWKEEMCPILEQLQMVTTELHSRQ